MVGITQSKVFFCMSMSWLFVFFLFLSIFCSFQHNNWPSNNTWHSHGTSPVTRNWIATRQRLTVTATVQVDKWQETAVHQCTTKKHLTEPQTGTSDTILFVLRLATPCTCEFIASFPQQYEATVTSILITSSPGSKQISFDVSHDGSCIKCHKLPLPLAKGHDVVHREQHT